MRESQIGSHDDFELDLNALLHPASAFDHPRDVVNDPDLTRHEKRAILSSCMISTVETVLSSTTNAFRSRQRSDGPCESSFSADTTSAFEA